MKEENNKPLKTFRLGSISATVWKNETKETEPRIVIEKSYKDKEDKWQTTNNYSKKDLPTIAWISKLAFDYATSQEVSSK